ncbi:MAG TPA: hypothetical protein VK324_03200, partial [Tepidisphaeraceae bacterium]|nr:hypothetical protein [Tepidisphaeraceae bacterium]
MRAVISTALATAAGALLLTAAPAAAAFEIVSQDLQLDRANGLGTFSLLFNQVPDFDTTDAFGRPQNSFQYEVDTNWNGSGAQPFAYESIGWVFRGDEIRFGGTVPI